MPSETVVRFEIDRLSILSPEGSADPELLPDLDDSQLLRLHELLHLTRTADERALALQREGRIGTYPASRGQEATQVGSAFALAEQDPVFPAFRELGVYLARGYPLDLIYRYWKGDERGLAGPAEIPIFPMCIAVGSHVLHAAGAAMAARRLGRDAVAVAYLGDGGTSPGDFHEALNLAGVYHLPLVVICQNNQWAISVPRSAQTAAVTLAQKALAHGIAGLQVDGNDVLAVYAATRDALARARRGEGPTLIECDTYRLGDHTTADDARRYRDPEELKAWEARDPLRRMERFLVARGLWGDAEGTELAAAQKALVDAAVARAEAAAPPDPGDVFRYTTQTLSSRQQEQLREVKGG